MKECSFACVNAHSPIRGKGKPGILHSATGGFPTQNRNRPVFRHISFCTLDVSVVQRGTKAMTLQKRVTRWDCFALNQWREAAVEA